jgi:hypothetical protein
MRRRVELTFEERLGDEARRLSKEAEKLPFGSNARDLILRRARQAETVLLWLRSPGLASPK